MPSNLEGEEDIIYASCDFSWWEGESFMACFER